MQDYPPAVAQLLTRGDPRERGGRWPDYLALGLGPEHIPDLIRMATDPDLNHADGTTDLVWAPLHAWRALGQLHAEAAVQPLLDTAAAEDDEWALDELPEVFALIGPVALPALAAFLGDPSRQEGARETVASAVARMGTTHPHTRPDCVAILARQLEQPAPPLSSVNGFIVAALLDLDGVEAAPAIERAYAAGLVDESICGDWPRVQYDLGLTDTPPPPRGYIKPFSQPSSRPLTPKARAKERAKKAKKERKKKRR
jgi:hypothetical protein